MKVSDDEARSIFQLMLDHASDNDLKDILDDLDTMTMDPRLNQRHVCVLREVFFAEVDRRIAKAKQDVELMTWAAFETKH